MKTKNRNKSQQVTSTSMSNSKETASASAIDTEFELRVGTKLSLLEELRDDLRTENIDVFGIAVIGSQSAGKSSVLETLTGIQFPRAQSTCTRVPAIVQLQTAPGESYAQVRQR
jgi:GTP-binding protein EngB required for normal cell division